MKGIGKTPLIKPERMAQTGWVKIYVKAEGAKELSKRLNAFWWGIDGLCRFQKYKIPWH